MEYLNLNSFETKRSVTIDSLKTHFLPIQEGEGDPSPDNIRQITGWNSIKARKCGKNLAKIVGYSATSPNSVSSTRRISNSYGTTLSTTYYSDELTIIQTQYPDTSNLKLYTNGYFCIVLDGLPYGKQYNVSFKVSNVVSNPLNATLSDIAIANPYGTYTAIYNVTEDGCLIYKNMNYKRHSANPNRCSISIYNCGMSFTLSEFMITAVEDEDFTYEPYREEEVEVSLQANLMHGSNLASYNDYWYNEPGISAYRFCDLLDGTALPVNFIFTDKDPSLEIPNVYFGVIYNKSHADDGYNWIIENGQIKGRNTNSQSYPSANLGRPCKYMFCYPASEDTLTAILQKYDVTIVPSAFYGGYIDFTKGEIVQEYYKYIITGDETLSTNSKGWVFASVPRPFDTTITAIYPYSGVCTHYPYAPYGRGKIGVMYNERTLTFDGQILDAAGWKAYCKDQYDNGTPVEICYKLKTPNTYPIPPETLKTLRGFNTIFSTGNDSIEVGYSEVSPINLLGIRRMMMNAQPYVFVDHIVGTGYKSRIDTGVPGDDDTLKFEGCFSCDTYTAWFAFFGNYTKSGDNYWRLAFTDSDIGSLSWVTNASAGFASRARQGSLVNFRVPFMIENLHAIYTVDGHVTDATRTSKTSGVTNNTNIIIGSSNATNDGGGYVKTTWYYFKIYQGETLIRNYKPCLRIAGRKYGFFETLSKTFYPSIGTVDFSAN